MLIAAVVIMLQSRLMLIANDVVVSIQSEPKLIVDLVDIEDVVEGVADEVGVRDVGTGRRREAVPATQLPSRRRVWRRGGGRRGRGGGMAGGIAGERRVRCG